MNLNLDIRQVNSMGIFNELRCDNQPAKLSKEESTSDKELCRHSLTLFAKTYLSEFVTDELCEFHIDIARHLEDLTFNHKEERTHSCIAAPRGFGKSLWTSCAFPLWQICYGMCRNILIVSSEGSLARQFVQDIKRELEDNPKIIHDFGDLVGTTTWTNEKIITSNKVAVIGKGALAALRGVKVSGYRVDYAICDDILNSKNSDTPEARDKTKSWYHKVLCPAVSKYGKVVTIGTLLSDSCLIADFLTQPQYSEYYRKKFQAVIEFSDEDKLWNEWQDKQQDLTDENAAETALKFYMDNKETMTHGTRVLWEREPDMYMKLMKIKAMDLESFSTECQNEGLLPEQQEFQDEWIQKSMCLVDEIPEILDVYIGVDAAAKAKLTSDDSAMIVIGRGSDNLWYVLETFSKKVTIDALIDQMLIYAIQYYSKIRRIAWEDVVFQCLIEDLMKRKSLDSGLYLPFEGIKVQQKKELKLRSLVTPVRNGYFRFQKDQRKLLEEMKRFPKARSDNLLDALWLSTAGIIGGTSASQFSFGSIAGQSSGNQANSKQPQSFFGKLFNR